MPDKIIKRDGRKATYTLDKIAKAIYKAARSVGGDDYDEAESLAEKVDAKIKKTVIGRDPSVEEIQDIVEEVLIDAGHAKTAKAYILYRDERTRAREANLSLMKTMESLTFAAAITADIKRENANINTDTAMGTMLKYGSESAKKFNSLNVLDPRHAKLHGNGDMHIHDFDFYMLTTTCCQIDLTKLFERGFSTGHGTLRTPNSIQSYAALACIAIQSNQNDQHGGQSIPDFDFAMARGIAKTFKNSYASNLAKLLVVKANLGTSYYPDAEAGIKEAIRINAENGLVPGLGRDNKACFMAEANILAKCKLYRMQPCEIAVLQLQAEALAALETERATHQAMEALIHNLNTMNSRAGAQVPFSSINYGTDTSPEGRLAIKCVLLATQEGLGRHETPIFPVQIFKIKSGVNYNPEDPNYDLFKLAMATSAKRMFPNFSFLDSPFNLKYYDPEDHNTEVSYMGCVDRHETISYVTPDMGSPRFRCEGIGRAYDRIRRLAGYTPHGSSEFIDTENLNISVWDSHAGQFVKVRKFIRNPNKNDWLKLTLTGGRELICTADHPLPIENKGRIFAKDVCIGDMIKIRRGKLPLPAEYDNNPGLSEETAWILGAMFRGARFPANNKTAVELSFGNVNDGVINRLESNIYLLKHMSKKLAPDMSAMDIECSTSMLPGETPANRRYRLSIKCGRYNDMLRDWLQRFFEGDAPANYSIPPAVFTWPTCMRAAFIAGIADISGSCPNENSIYAVPMGSKENALQLVSLLQSIDIPASYSSSSSINITAFPMSRDIADKMAMNISEDGISPMANISSPIHFKTRVESVECVLNDGHSYDLETESDRFDISGIFSHNCRTRVIGNVYDPSRQTTAGRGNLSFTTINMPRLAIEAKQDLKIFYALLDKRMKDACDQLMHRYKIQAQKTPRNFPFLMGQGVWMDSENLDIDEPIGEILRHGTLSVGFIGLAETLIALTGKHHGENEDARNLGIQIITHMREYLDNMSARAKMNFTLLATPAEGLSGRFVAIDRQRYGVIPGVTDRKFYTNSFHVPVYYNITAFDKIRIEGPYHALTNAGHISYVELDGDPSNNLDAFEKIVRCMHDNNIGYGAINHPIDRDPCCGYSGIIGDVCPQCGRREKSEIIEKIKRPEL